MSTPIYGKQYIRFAETFQVAQGTVVNQFRVVELTGAPGAHPPLLVEQSNGGASVGVSQFTLNDNVPPTGFATDETRMLSVATSGLLLVEGDGKRPGFHGPAAGRFIGSGNFVQRPARHPVDDPDGLG